MEDIQYQFVKNILADAGFKPEEAGEAFAPSNIALCKYWGKRDPILNLPVNSSLSISLDTLGTHTRMKRVDATADRVQLNGEPCAPGSAFAERVCCFLDLFRPCLDGTFFEVHTCNTVPTAAGLASSASGFAALVLALNEWAGWKLDRRSLSMLARLGSGSAARSVCDGFVQWNAGSRTDGLDSYAEPLDAVWPDFRIGVLEVSAQEKPVGSRDGMNRTVETSSLYESWPAQAAADLETIHQAVMEQDFDLLGRTAEHNALSMHATMLGAWPPLIYLLPESLDQICRVHALRADGVPVFLTMDAGPNLKLLFLKNSESSIRDVFPDLKIIAPFCSTVSS